MPLTPIPPVRPVNPQFESVSTLSNDIAAFITQFATWVRGSAAGTLSGRAPQLHEMRSVHANVKSFNDQAKRLLALPEFATLSDAQKRDITAIAEETDIALVQLADDIDPDKHWAKMRPERKQDLVDREPIDSARADSALSILAFENRRQRKQTVLREDYHPDELPRDRGPNSVYPDVQKQRTEEEK